jgi:hypothetical protein
VKFIQTLGLSADHDFDSPIGQVLGVAVETEPPAVAGHKPAEPHTLNLTRNQESNRHPAPTRAFLAFMYSNRIGKTDRKMMPRITSEKLSFTAGRLPKR